MTFLIKKITEFRWLPFFFYSLFLLPNAAGEEAVLIVGDSIDFNSDLSSWINQETVDKGPKYNECRVSQSGPSVMLCVHGSPETMHNFIGRASAFAEGIGAADNPSGRKIPKGVVFPRGSRPLQGYRKSLIGFDLRGSDLMNYYNEVNAKCAAGYTKKCFSPDERDFFVVELLPKIKKDPNFVLLTGSTEEGLKKFKYIIEHEVMHAKYFTDAKFREVVDDYWNKYIIQGDPMHKKIAEDYLTASYGYSDEYFIRNEFQAHLLIGGEVFTYYDTDFFKHRDRLIGLLRQQDLAPAFIDSKNYLPVENTEARP